MLPTLQGATELIVGALAAAGICACIDVTPPPPVVTATAVTPASGPMAGGTSVSVTGHNFADVTSVTIGGAELATRTVLDTTQITGTTPASTTSGTQDVVVTSTSHGSGTCSGCFTYNPAVTVTSVSPASGSLTGGTSVAITGTNFVNVTSVTIGGSELGSRIVLSVDQITGIAPAGGSTGAKDVFITSSSHGIATCIGCFTYNPPLTVMSVSPNGGPQTGGTSVQISGTGFIDISSVKIGSVEFANWNVESTTRIVGTTPASPSLGARDVSVISSSQGSDSCLGCFSYVTSADWRPEAVIGLTTVIAISSGTDSHHTCALVSTGAAWCWGINTAGQLGIDTTTPRSAVPVAVSGGRFFSTIRSSLTHNCGVTGPGAAYCWGDNAAGELGDGTMALSFLPVPVSGGFQFTALAVGVQLTCGVSSTPYCWGSNANGAIGNGSDTNSAVPTAVSGGLVLTVIATSGYHVCGLTAAGAAYCWGDNSYGALGDGSQVASRVPVSVTGGHAFTAVVTGDQHTCGLTASGTAYCWGDNTFGQLGCSIVTCGLGSSSPFLVSGNLLFTQLAAGDWHTCGLTSSGTAYCWGDNSYGQLGDPAVGWWFAEPTPVYGNLAFTALAAGGEHTCGLRQQGDVYCWGWNDSGQLGRGTFGSLTSNQIGQVLRRSPSSANTRVRARRH